MPARVGDPGSEAHDVVRAAGLGAGSDRGALPAAERLALHDRARDPAVDVEVARLDGLEPLLELARVEAVQARGESVGDRVLEADGLLERAGAHHAEHRSEELGEVEVRPGLHAVADAGRPEAAGLVLGLRLHEPLLADAELRERVLELAGGRLDDRAHLRGRVRRVAHAQRRHGVGELREEPAGLPDRAHEDHEARRRALLAGVAERALHDVGGGQVEVGARGHDDGVLAAGLREEREVRAPGAEDLCGLVAAREDHAVDRLVGDEVLAELGLARVDEREQLARHARLAERLDQHGAGAAGLACGLDDHAAAGGEGREHAARGDRDGEVPRRCDHCHARRHEPGALHAVEVARALGVVVREVHGLADLGVGLGDGLAGLRRHHLDEARAVALDRDADAVQERRALVAGAGAPGRGGRADAVDDVVQLLGGVDARGLDGRDAELRGLDARQDLAAPGAVRRQRRIRVRRVVERGRGGGGVDERVGRQQRAAREALDHARELRVDLLLGLLRRLGLGERIHVVELRREAAVLRAVRRGDHVVDALQRRAEPRLLPGEQLGRRAQLEHRRHEVLLARVLLQSADEVRDGHVELGRVHDGRVEQEPADGALHGLGLAGRHAEQHLELDAGGDAALLREQPRVRDVEEVVPGDADLHGVGRGGLERVLEHPLVVRVGLLLGGPGGDGPVVHAAVDLLHREVRALHDADLDGRAARRAPLLRPCRQPLEAGERVGEVRLQHDPGLEVLQLRLVEHAREHLDREVEVLVLLHVEVDELGGRRLRRQLVQRGQALDDLVDGLVERPHRQLRDDARHLDGDVVHVVAGEQLARAREAARGLLLAEDGLAEQVEVEAGSALAQLGDRRAELLARRVDDEVADHLAQHAARDGHDHLREDGAEDAARADRALHVPGEEARGLGGERGEAVAGDRQVLGTDDAVDEADGEVEAVLVLEDAGEALGGGIRGVLGRLGEPGAHERDGPVGERLAVRCVGGAVHRRDLRGLGGGCGLGGHAGTSSSRVGRCAPASAALRARPPSVRPCSHRMR